MRWSQGPRAERRARPSFWQRLAHNHPALARYGGGVLLGLLIVAGVGLTGFTLWVWFEVDEPLMRLFVLFITTPILLGGVWSLWAGWKLGRALYRLRAQGPAPSTVSRDDGWA